jgi:hypothetical protein
MGPFLGQELSPIGTRRKQFFGAVEEADLAGKNQLLSSKDL